jgi:hypothetical protein
VTPTDPGEPLGVSFAEPFDVTGDNPGTEIVRFGAGQADETCVMFAFTDSPLPLVGRRRSGRVRELLPGQRAIDAEGSHDEVVNECAGRTRTSSLTSRRR